MADTLGVRQRFNEILEASRTQDRSRQSATMVVLGHLQQMVLLMIKKGLFFYCEQDTYRARTKFIQDLLDLNKLDIRFPAIIRNFLLDGCGLFYFRPDPKLKYQIYFFSKDQYRVYHDINGNIDEVVIIYSYKVRNSNLGLPSDSYGMNERFVRISITNDHINEFEANTELSFELEPGAILTPRNSRPNNLGFIPAVEVLNKPNSSGTEGEGEFEPFMEQIVLHDQMMRNIAKNIEFFGNPAASNRIKTLATDPFYLFSSDHPLALMLPEALNTTEYGSKIGIAIRDMNFIVLAGVALDSEPAGAALPPSPTSSIRCCR
jgi:hypothetical protein